MAKTLIAYFSVSGNTAKVAHEIAQATGGKLFSIDPEKAYTNADIRWTDKNSRASLENSDASSRPEIANKVEDMAQYDTLFLGFPIWWHTFPKIILSFIESYDLKGKYIIPFATSGGSNIEQAQKELKNLLPDSTVNNGRSFNNASSKEVQNWAESALN